MAAILSRQCRLWVHERRPLHQTAARRFPLYPVSDQGNAAAQYVAKGQGTKSLRSSPLVPWRFLDAGELGLPSLLFAGVQRPAQ